MTDQTPMPPETPKPQPATPTPQPMTPTPQPATPTPAPSKSMLAGLSQGEKFVGLGAVVVLAVYLIWELIQEEYFVEWMAIYLAIYLLFTMWVKMNRPQAKWSVPYVQHLRVVGYLLFMVGALEIIDDVRRDIFDADGGTIVGAIVFWAGCIIAGWGAKQLD